MCMTVCSLAEIRAEEAVFVHGTSPRGPDSLDNAVQH